jgi:mannose-6-phosphate isomerase-like protein (cupin superfamily)
MTSDQKTSAPVSVIGPHEGELLRAGPVLHRVLEDGSTTDGRLGLVECRMPPGWGGPPQHVHRAHDESFFVLTGHVRFSTGSTEHVLGPGALFTAGIGAPHTFGKRRRRRTCLTAPHGDTRAVRRVLPGTAGPPPRPRRPARRRGRAGIDVAVRHRTVPHGSLTPGTRPSPRRSRAACTTTIAPDLTARSVRHSTRALRTICEDAQQRRRESNPGPPAPPEQSAGGRLPTSACRSPPGTPIEPPRLGSRGGSVVTGRQPRPSPFEVLDFP